MRPVDVVRYAFSDFTGSKFKTTMSSLGIIIGIASVIVILTLGDGLYAIVNQQVGNLEADTIMVASGSGQDVQIGNNVGGSPPARLTDNDVNLIANVSGVKEVHPEINFIANGGFNDMNRSVAVMAIVPHDESRLIPDLSSGRFLTDTDQYAVVLGNITASSTFGKQIDVGDYVTLTNVQTGQSRDYAVVGILKKRNLSALLYDSNAIAYMTKDGLAGISGRVTYSLIGVRVTGPDLADATAERINATIAGYHKNELYSIMTQQSAIDSIGTIIDAIKAVLACIAGVSLVVGGIGILNVMTLTVRERTREIGLLRAVGSTAAEVRLVFLAESALLGTVSGLIGVAIAEIAAVAAGSVIGISLGVSLQNALLGVGFGLVITVLFAVYPANRAARMDPAVALRAE